MFTDSKSSTVNKRLPIRLYHFCVELAKKTDSKCIYNTVKQTNFYDNHTFILHGKKVVPTSIYDGIWINPDSTCDHTGEDCDFWFSIDGYVFVIVEVNNRFYIPKLSSFNEDNWKESKHPLKDLAIKIIHKKQLVKYFYNKIECFDTFIEQKLDNIIILDELYHKVKINNNLYRALKAFSEKNNYVCIYSSIKSDFSDRECLLNDKLVKTKIYGGFFIDKNSRKIDNSNVSYDGNYYRFGEVDNKFYYCMEDRSLKEKDCSSSIQKYIHLANKNNLLHEKITIGECTYPTWPKIFLESILANKNNLLKKITIGQCTYPIWPKIFLESI